MIVKRRLPYGLVNKIVVTVGECNDFWRPGTRDGVPPILMNCNFFKWSYLFQFFFSIVCVCHVVDVYWKFTVLIFALFEWRTWRRRKFSSANTSWSNNPLSTEFANYHYTLQKFNTSWLTLSYYIDDRWSTQVHSLNFDSTTRTHTIP